MRKHTGREHDVTESTRRADETHKHKQPTRENDRATEAEPPATANKQAGPAAPLARPAEAPTTHPRAHFTGAGFFLINTNGWVAGLGKNGLWQDFGGRREQNESPIQTAARELQEETGIDASTVRMLAPPYWMRKDEHVYVIHIARVADTVWPERSNELTVFTELKQFWSGFEGETNTAVHRRVLDRPFLAAAGRIHTEIERNGRTSRRTTPTAAPATTQVRKDSGRSRGEGSATSLDPKTLPRVCGNRNHNQHQEIAIAHTNLYPSPTGYCGTLHSGASGSPGHV